MVIVTLSGVLVAIISFWVALKQYSKINRFRKAEYFFNLKNTFRTNSEFIMIRQKIELNENMPEDFNSKLYSYLGFFEELQIAINSGFIDKKMVFYLFGYYVINCDEYIRKNGEINIDLDKPLWAVFKELSISMRLMGEGFVYRRDLKF
jgi:hypothetical protein